MDGWKGQLSGISFFFMGKAMLFPCRFSLNSNAKPVDLSPKRIGREIHPCCQVRQNISTGPWGSDGEMGVSKNHQNPWLIHHFSLLKWPFWWAIVICPIQMVTWGLWPIKVVSGWELSLGKGGKGGMLEVYR